MSLQKIIQISFSLCLFLTISFGSQAQNKFDLIDCLEVIFNDPELEPIFVMDMDFGKGAVIISGDSFGGFGQHKERQILESVEDYDLNNITHPVKIMTAEEFRNTGVSDEDGGLIYLGFDFKDGKMNANIRSSFPNSRKMLQGAYSLEKKSGSWKLVSKSVKMARG